MLLAAVGLAMSLPSTAADPPRGPDLHALTGARIVIAPGQVLDSGTLVVRDGVIEAVGAEVEAPAGARVRELDEITLYPGLIESFVTLDAEEDDEADDDAPRAGAENPLVRPEHDLTDQAFDASTFKNLRAAGFTTAVLVPEAGLLRGRSVVSNLGDDGVRSNLLRADAAQNLRFVTRNGAYPTSLMGSIALFRQSLLDARWYAQARDAYEARPTQARPDYDRSLEALGPVVRGEARLVFESGDLLDVLRFGALRDELARDGVRLDPIIVGDGAEYRRAAEVADLGVPLILPLAFPESPEVGAEGDALHVDLEELRHWREAPSNPSRLADAGVDFVLTAHHLDTPKDLHGQIARAVEAGWSADAALAALTTEPAALWGLSGVAGTLEVGKMANLLEVEGDLFVESPKILAVWIDGRRHEIGSSEPPTVEPAGTWELTIEQDGETLTAVLKLEGEATDLDGTIVAFSRELPLRDVEVSGDTLSFSFDPSPIGLQGIISSTLEIDGDRASGSGSGASGAFSVTGRRTAGPETDPDSSRGQHQGHDRGQHPHPHPHPHQEIDR